MAAKSTKSTKETTSSDRQTATCGLIMPIGPLDGCTAEHWAEVKAIIGEAVESISEPAFSVRLVSDADDVGIIQKRIVQNVYSSDIVVCDVSAKNPNVMFELGLRLAFDKPVVIVKDDKTDYSFDTGIIEHVGYPRDLRFARVVDFKLTLAAKVLATYKYAASRPDQSPFLKNFGKFHVASLEETAVSADRLVLDAVEDLRHEMRRIQRTMDGREPSRSRGDLAAFFADVASTIPKYLESEGITETSGLVDNPKFADFIEKACSAPVYFTSPSDFRRALDGYLRALAIPKKAVSSI